MNTQTVYLSGFPMHNFLDSRKLEGAMHKLSHYIPRLRACDHSTIIERLNKLEQNLDIDKSKNTILLLMLQAINFPIVGNILDISGK